MAAISISSEVNWIGGGLHSRKTGRVWVGEDIMRLAVVLAVALLGGCAVIDTGVVDFRRAQNLSTEDIAERRVSFLQRCQNLVEKSAGTNQIVNCDPVLPATLVDKFTPTGAGAIANGDVFSIRLDYGVIAEMTEMPKIAFRSQPAFRQNGEVAVLVNAFEFADTAEGAASRKFFELGQGGSPDQAGTSFAQARVVYFSPDVDKGQPLNFSNLPIIGPQRYGGRPVGLQIIVVELDRMSPAVKSMLKGLADLGKTAVNAGPASDALFSLGKSLLDGAQDDVIFEYRMVMDNAAHTSGQVVSTFQAGRLVFRRAQERRADFVWRSLVLDHNTGALYLPENEGRQTALSQQDKDKAQRDPQTLNEGAVSAKPVAFQPYRAETYFTVNIIDHGSNGPIGFYENQKWSETSAAFDAYVANTQVSSTEAAQQIAEMLVSRRSLNASSEAGSKVEEMVTRWRAYGMTALPATPVAIDQAKAFPDYASGEPAFKTSCEMAMSTLWTRSAKAGTLRAQARQSALELLRSLQATSAAPQPTLQTTEFDLTTQRLWIALLSQLLVTSAQQAASEAKFLTGASFATAYLGDGLPKSNDFLTLMDEYAKNLAPKDCANALLRAST